VHHTHSPSTLPELGKKRAYQAHRAGVAERCEEVAVPKTMAVALALITSEEQRLNALARLSLKTAKPPEAQPLDRLQTGPGLGNILRLVWLDAMHQLERLPRGQDCAAYGRLVKCANASGGKRLGTSGTTMGHAHLPGAFSEAATLCLRGHEPGPKSLARVEKKPDTGQARRIFAHPLARAGDGRLKRHTALALAQCLCPSGRRAREPGAALDTAGRRLHPTARKPQMAASSHAAVRLGPLALRPALCLDTRSGS
jgi:transposase